MAELERRGTMGREDQEPHGPGASTGASRAPCRQDSGGEPWKGGAEGVLGGKGLSSTTIIDGNYCSERLEVFMRLQTPKGQSPTGPSSLATAGRSPGFCGGTCRAGRAPRGALGCAKESSQV